MDNDEGRRVWLERSHTKLIFCPNCGKEHKVTIKKALKQHENLGVVKDGESGSVVCRDCDVILSVKSDPKDCTDDCWKVLVMEKVSPE